MVVPASLPATDFPLGRVTQLGIQPAEKAYTQSDLWWEIPKLGVKMDILGVPDLEGQLGADRSRLERG